jgi:carbonyl reductase 1
MAAPPSAAAGSSAVSSTVTALVTGANRGLGRELAAALLARGWRVIGTARSWEGRGATPPPPPGLERARLEVTSSAQRAALAASLPRGSVDVLINNAGVFPSVWDASTYAHVLDTNLVGPVALTRQLAADGVLAPGAVVVNVTSGYGRLSYCSPAYRAAITSAASVDALLAALPFLPAEGARSGMDDHGAYKVSKAAVNRASQLLAAELRGAGVAVGAVSPGWCSTDMGGPGAPRTPAQGAASIASAVDALRAGAAPSGAVFDERGGVDATWAKHA